MSDKYSVNSFFFTDIKNLDITDENAVRKFVCEHHIEAISNCAGYTAVDKAEEKNLADIVNFHAVKIIAQIGKEKNCRFIRILTDLVFGLKQRTLLLP